MRVTLNITQVKRKSLVTVVVIVSRFKSEFHKFLNLYFIKVFFFEGCLRKLEKYIHRDKKLF